MEFCVGSLALFIGTFYHNLDAKNRVTVPRKILEKAGVTEQSAKFYISMGMEECLFLFTEERWKILTLSFENQSMGKSDARDFQRLFFSDTYEVDLDGSGRILIPEGLKTAAELEREVVFLGAGTRVEIWDADRWKIRKSKIVGGYAKIASEII